jgi:hypothetical protein
MGRARVPARREDVPEANGAFSSLIKGRLWASGTTDREDAILPALGPAATEPLVTSRAPAWCWLLYRRVPVPSCWLNESGVSHTLLFDALRIIANSRVRLLLGEQAHLD